MLITVISNGKYSTLYTVKLVSLTNNFIISLAFFRFLEVNFVIGAKAITMS